MTGWGSEQDLTGKQLVYTIVISCSDWDPSSIRSYSLYVSSGSSLTPTRPHCPNWMSSGASLWIPLPPKRKCCYQHEKRKSLVIFYMSRAVHKFYYWTVESLWEFVDVRLKSIGTASANWDVLQVSRFDKVGPFTMGSFGNTIAMDDWSRVPCLRRLKEQNAKEYLLTWEKQ